MSRGNPQSSAHSNRGRLQPRSLRSGVSACLQLTIWHAPRGAVATRHARAQPLCGPPPSQQHPPAKVGRPQSRDTAAKAALVRFFSFFFVKNPWENKDLDFPWTQSKLLSNVIVFLNKNDRRRETIAALLVPRCVYIIYCCGWVLLEVIDHK